MYNPIPPDILANAEQDPIHRDIGRSRPAYTKRTIKNKLITSNDDVMDLYRKLYEQAVQDGFSSEYLSNVYIDGEADWRMLNKIADEQYKYPEELLRMYEKWQNEQPYRDCLLTGEGIDAIKGKEYLFDELLVRLGK